MAIDLIKLLQNNLKKSRKQKKLTQEALSGLSGISCSYLSEIERGKTVPSLRTIIAISDALGVEVHVLLNPNL